MITTMKFYLFALFIALLAFGGTRFIMRDRHATLRPQPSLQLPNWVDHNVERLRVRVEV
jgi:hypothetical protein